MEECRSLDIRRLHRAGVLRDGQGWMGAWRWRDHTDREVASVGMVASERAVRLSYTVTWAAGDREPEPISYTIPVVQTDCHFGGQRPWFLCPGRNCGRRVAKLFLPIHSDAKYYLCRYCYGLVYASQYQDEFLRLLETAWRIKRQVGGEPGIQYPLPLKPHGMHWATYCRIAQAYRRAVGAACRTGLAQSHLQRDRLRRRFG